MTIVLVVEDDKRMRGALERALSHRGITVWTAASVVEAQSICATHDEALDLAVLDGNLTPDRVICDSLPLIGWLRDRYPNIRLVAASGLAEYRTLMLESGCDVAVGKDGVVASVCHHLIGDR